MTKNSSRAHAHDKRPPPWYRTFASDDLSSSCYFGLSVGERGLLDSMARAYWCEGPLPESPRLLAALVRLPESEVTQSFTGGVLAHFERVNGSLVHRELARQRRQSDAARNAMSEGGSKGARAANSKRAGHLHAPQPAPQGTPQPTSQGTDMNCTALHCTELRSVEGAGLPADEEWVSSYESTAGALEQAEAASQNRAATGR